MVTFLRDDTVIELVAGLREADEALLEHGTRVAGLAMRIGTHLGMSDERVARLCRAALLHDTGKRYIPEGVLRKRGPLAAHEWLVVEAHAAFGERELLDAGMPGEAIIVRHHHEHWNGLGYPDRLVGDMIPLESRIIHVADAFDAMTSERPFRARRSEAEAIAEIRRGGGRQFDPDLAADLPGLFKLS